MKIISTTSEIETSVEKISITFTDNNGKEFTAEFTRRNNIKPLPRLMQSDDPYDHISLENQVKLYKNGMDTSDSQDDELWETARNYSAPAPEDNDSKTHAVIMGIDWNLVNLYKTRLKEVITDNSGVIRSPHITTGQLNSIGDVLSLLDSLQDAVVEDGLFKEEEVFAAEGSDSIEPGCDSTVQVQSAMPIEEMKKAYDSIGESYNRLKDILDASPIMPEDMAEWRRKFRDDVINIAGLTSPLPSDVEEYGKVDTAPGEEEPEPAKLDMTAFLAIPLGTIWSTGITLDQRLSTTEVRWIAKKGDGWDDWAIYYHFSTHDVEYIKHQGEKCTTKNVIQKLVPCTDEVLNRYRY